MKKNILFAFVIAFFASCGGTNDKGDLASKRAQLEELKKQQTLLKAKISTLEMQLDVIDTSKQKDDKAKFIKVTEAVPQTFTHFIEVQAKVEGDEDVSLNAEMPGNVTAVLVRPGDKVTRGQVLATLEDRAIKQNMASMKAQLDMAVTMYERQKNLWDQKIGSEVQFIQARTQKDAMEKQYAGLREQWDMTRIKSPINGTVDQVNIKIGQTAAPGMTAIRVVNLSNLKVKGEIAESYITKVKRGNDVLLYFPDINKEIQAKLDYSGQVVNSLNRTFNVEVHLNSKDADIRPNQSVILKIADYTADSSFVVPIGVVQKSSDEEYVYVAENINGKLIAKRKPVISGMVYSGNTEIKSGLATGDKVITTGYQNVIDGDPIKL
jgi:membrane fusion protein (multidrug efflux system)